MHRGLAAIKKLMYDSMNKPQSWLLVCLGSRDAMLMPGRLRGLNFTRGGCLPAARNRSAQLRGSESCVLSSTFRRHSCSR